MVVVVLWLLNVFGVLGHLHDVRVTTQAPTLDVPIGVSSPSVDAKEGLRRGADSPGLRKA